MSQPRDDQLATGSVTRHLASSKAGDKKKNRPSRNPLQTAILEFLANSIAERNGDCFSEERQSLAEYLVDHASDLPKRFTLYSPLLLLPSNFFPSSLKSQVQAFSRTSQTGAESHNQWHKFVSGLDYKELRNLWSQIAKTFRKDGVTHVAIGAPIQLELPGNESSGTAENVLRSPIGITGVYGDFGLAPSNAECSGDDENDECASEFNKALWVSTIQNSGIIQVWAPMFTMFSRGNIKEKARIITGVSPTTQSAYHPPVAAASSTTTTHVFPGLADELSQPLSKISVLDLYIGIGYFAFSYLTRGVGLVIGFELNAWSVEGLRRGAERNGWACEVIRLPPFFPKDRRNNHYNSGPIIAPEALHKAVTALRNPEIRLLVFHADNRWSTTILPLLQNSLSATETETENGTWKPIRHINLGLLPSSLPTWSHACKLLLLLSLHPQSPQHQQRGGYIHIHENVESENITTRAEEIIEKFETFIREVIIENDLREEDGDGVEAEEKGGREGNRIQREEGIEIGWKIECLHIERVKMYAPGIWHCVFDVWIHL